MSSWDELSLLCTLARSGLSHPLVILTSRFSSDHSPSSYQVVSFHKTSSMQFLQSRPFIFPTTCSSTHTSHFRECHPHPTSMLSQSPARPFLTFVPPYVWSLSPTDSTSSESLLSDPPSRTSSLHCTGSGLTQKAVQSPNWSSHPYVCPIPNNSPALQRDDLIRTLVVAPHHLQITT